jgi:hypothetical protein
MVKAGWSKTRLTNGSPSKLGPSSMTSTSRAGTKGGEHKGTWPVMRIDSEKTSRIFAHNILVNSSSTSFKSDSMACN